MTLSHRQKPQSLNMACCMFLLSYINAPGFEDLFEKSNVLKYVILMVDLWPFLVSCEIILMLLLCW